MKKLLCLLCCCMLMLPCLPACAAEAAVDLSALTKPKDTNVSWDESAVTVTLEGASSTVAGDGASWDGSVLTFTKEGDYLLSGSLTGRLVVSADQADDVRLILNSVTITSPEGPALYVQSADKVILTLAEGSVNQMDDATSLTDGEDTISSCLYSRDDLSINGAGALTVNGHVKNGVVCKNDLLIVGGALTVTALNDGVRGKDSLTILGGSLDVTSGGDGLVSDSEEEAGEGCVLIAGGALTVTAGGGAGNAEARVESWGRWDIADTASEDGVSAKAIKAADTLSVQGGTLALDSADDALHAANVTLSGGVLTLASGDDGVHADDALIISGGEITITQSYEGLEGTTIAIGGGEISLVASDDGVNAAGGNDQSGFGGDFGGFDRFGADSGASIVISGGVLRVNASGDGLDSNGSLTFSGGETYVSGPTNTGNGALDYGGECAVTGGVLVAAGAGGMAQNVGSASTQATLMVSGGGGGGEIVLRDESGNVLLSYTPEKDYNSVVLSCPGMSVGSAYTVAFGGSEVYSGTLTQTVTGGEGGFGGNFGGGFGGGGKGGPGGGRR